MFLSNTVDVNYPNFNPLEHQKKSRLVAGLLLMVVVVLHLALALYLLSVPKIQHNQPLAVMEVVMLPKPEPIVKQPAKEPPAPPPAPKTPIKPKPVVKPPKPIKKPVAVNPPAPLPATIKEVTPVPKFVPAPTAIAVPPVAMPASAAAPSPPSLSGPSPSSSATGRGQASGKTAVSGVAPLLRVQPKYPARALNRHIEGWVKVEFTVRTDGSVGDAIVVSAEPDTVFNEAALTAIGKWKFKEKIVNGVAVPQRAVQKLQFKLTQ